MVSRREKQGAGRPNARAAAPGRASWWPAALSVGAFGFLLALSPVSDPDMGTHLRAGRWIVEHRSVPRVDVFTHSLAGMPWCDWEWAAQVVLHAADRAGGVTGVEILVGLVSMATAVIAVAAARADGATPGAAALAVAGALVVGAYRLVPRPEIFSALGMVTPCWLLALRRRGHRRALWAVPALVAAWVNFHPGVLIGGLVLGLTFVGELLQRHPRLRGAREPWPLREMLGVGAASTLVLLVNPYGAGVVREAVALLGSPFMGAVREYQPPFSPVFAGLHFVALFVAWLALLALVQIPLWSERRLDAMLACAGLAALPLGGARHVGLYAWATVGALAVGLSVLVRGRRARAAPYRMAKGATAASLVVLAAGPATAFGPAATWIDASRSFGFGLLPGQFPERAVAFMDRNGIHGTIFNEYRWGGYLEWRRDDLVYQDGRNISWEQFQQTRRILEGGAEGMRLLDRGGVDHALVARSIPARPNPIAGALQGDDRWALVAWDDDSLLFLRRGARFDRAVSEHEYRCIEPASADVSARELAARSACVRAELLRARREAPGDAWVLLFSGQMLAALGDREAAAAAYRELLAVRPGDPDATGLLRDLQDR